MEIPTYIYIVSPLFNGLIFLVGLLGNICVMIVVIKVRSMRTPTNVFLLNLSVADILVLLVCQPAGLLEFFGKDRWFLGKFMCKFSFCFFPLTNTVFKCNLHLSLYSFFSIFIKSKNTITGWLYILYYLYPNVGDKLLILLYNACIWFVIDKCRLSEKSSLLVCRRQCW